MKNDISPLYLYLCPKQLHGILKDVPEGWSITATDYLTLFDICEIQPECIKTITPILFLSAIQAKHEGSSCIKLFSIKQYEILKSFGYKEPEIEIQNWINSIIEGKLSIIVGIQPNQFKPLLLISKSDEYFLYFHKTYFAEDTINGLLFKMISKVPQRNFKSIDNFINLFNGAHSIHAANGASLIYNDEQKSAIALSMQSSISIITGGPGTGKTFTLTGILRAFVANEVHANEIILAAPTARAATRMRDTIVENFSRIQKPLETDINILNIESKTLHRLLGISPNEPEGYFSKLYPLPYKVVIIDEASMIDLKMMKVLMGAMDIDNTSLILLGDKDQLPSVSEGAVLADLLQRLPPKNIVTLKQFYRSEMAISNFIKSIRDRQFEKLLNIKKFESISEFYNQSDSVVGLISISDMNAKDFFKLIQFCAENYFSKAIVKLFNSNSTDQDFVECLTLINQFKILTLVNNGKFGVQEINRLCRDYFIRRLSASPLQRFFKGLPIQILENNDSLDIYNGDLGLCVHSENELTQIGFYKGGQIKKISVSLLPPSQLGFCTTVHKSQGSEYDEVLLIIPNDSPASLLNRQLIYTAISRAKHKCLILSDISNLMLGLQTEFDRETGILRH